MTDVMRIQDVLEEEIPEGDYNLAMKEIIYLIKLRLPYTGGLEDEWDRKQRLICESCCAAFTALLKLSRGEYVEKKAVKEAIDDWDENSREELNQSLEKLPMRHEEHGRAWPK